MNSNSPSRTTPNDAAVTFQEVGENQAGQRLDNFLLSRLKGVPKSRIYRIIRKGEVRVNKKRAKPDYKLASGDNVRIPPLRLAQSSPQLPPGRVLTAVLENAVLYRDDDLIIINKPAGLAVHGGTGVKTSLIEALRHIEPDAGGLELVHRLDKGTSGCLLLARNGKTLKALSEQFRRNTVKKTYHALVEGAWPETLTEVGAALQRLQPQGGERFVKVHSDGKKALTHFRILASLPTATLLQANPVTGRTHQIRVHAQLAGHPIIGDEKYSDSRVRKQFADAGIRRLCLHAATLHLEHPVTGKALTVTAPYDTQFTEALRVLGQATD